MIAEAAEGTADEVHSAEQAAEMESVADQEVRGIFCFFSFFSSFSSCLLPLLSHAPSLHLPPSFSLSLPFTTQAATDAAEAEAQEVEAEFLEVRC